MSVMNILYVALGGAIGSVARYLVSGMTYKYVSGTFHWGTVAVNLTGCFLAGLLWGIGERTHLPPAFRTFLFVGILGGYTTFSAFSLENLNLIRVGAVMPAVFNMLIGVLGGLALVFAGLWCAGVNR